MKLLVRFFATVFALLGIAYFVQGFSVANIYVAMEVAIVLGLVNLLIRPLILLITLPINLLTLGLFTFVVNALMIWLVAVFIQDFSVSGFMPALLAALILAVVHWVVHRFTK